MRLRMRLPETCASNAAARDCTSQKVKIVKVFAVAVAKSTIAAYGRHHMLVKCFNSGTSYRWAVTPGHSPRVLDQREIAI
jgi:hypothetical protein